MMDGVVELENQAPALRDQCMLKYFGQGDGIVFCAHYPVACRNNTCAYKAKMDQVKRDLLNRGHNINVESLSDEI